MQITWQYIAGFFDGEGCIHMNGRQTTLLIAQSSATEKPPSVLIDISAFISDHGIKHSLSTRKKQPKDKQKPYTIQISNRAGVVAFLGGVRPYLRVKKVKCEDVLRYFILFPRLTQASLSKQQEYMRSGAIGADLSSGMTWPQVAKKHGCSLATVYRRLNPERMRKWARDNRARKKTKAGVAMVSDALD